MAKAGNAKAGFGAGSKKMGGAGQKPMTPKMSPPKISPPKAAPKMGAMPTPPRPGAPMMGGQPAPVMDTDADGYRKGGPVGKRKR